MDRFDRYIFIRYIFPDCNGVKRNFSVNVLNITVDNVIIINLKEVMDLESWSQNRNILLLLSWVNIFFGVDKKYIN